MSNIQIVHAECGRELFLQASIPSIFLSTSLTLIGDTINIIPGQIIASSFKLKLNLDTLYCQNCKHKVKLEEVVAQCSVCHSVDTLNNLFVAVPKADEATATNLIHKGKCYDSLVSMYARYFRREIQIDLHEVKFLLGGEQ